MYLRELWSVLYIFNQLRSHSGTPSVQSEDHPKRLPISSKKKVHKHKLFGLVALDTTPGMSLGQPARFCPWDKPTLSRDKAGTKPGFLLILHTGSPVCPRDKPSLSLGQSRGRRAPEKIMR